MSEPRKQSSQVYKLGGVVSIIQCALFWIIALCALGLGIDNFVSKGFGDLHQVSPWIFSSLCTAFVFIALLGIAITPAEKQLLSEGDHGLATWGSYLAYLGHMGTVAFFSWWIIFINQSQDPENIRMANTLIPIKWGVMFELFFVGAWVWIHAFVIFKHGILSKRFGIVSIAKAASFWVAFIAFLLNEKLTLLCGVTLVAVIFGPWWHMWIAVKYMLPRSKEA